MIACQVRNGTSWAIFPYCTAGTNLYLPCNIFRIARQVRNCTRRAIFSVLHGRYEIVPAVQYFPYCTAGMKWYLLCDFYRFLPMFPYCTAGTWVFASRGVPLKTRSPKGPPKGTPYIYFWGPFLNNFPPKCTCCAILWGRLFSATFLGHQRCSNKSPKGPPEAKKEAHGTQNGSPGPPKNEENEGSGAKQ